MTVLELFEDEARRSPQAVAVVSGSDSVTYGELSARADRIARVLRAHGVGRETIVAILVSRCVHAPAALLGTMKAGAAYLPLEPADPDRRLAGIVEDSRAAVLLTESALEDRALRLGTPAVVSVEHALAHGRGGTDVGTAAAPSDLAYVIYTSGSTGRPKGVLVEHGSLRSYVEWAIGAYGVGPASTSLVQSSIAFDLTVTSLLVPLAAGGRVVLLPQGSELPALVTYLRGGGAATLLKLTPAHLDVLSDELAPGELTHLDGYVVVGGEQLYWRQVREWRAVAPRTVVVNEYGPTEATVGCCAFEARGDGVGAVPIGAAAAGAEILLVDGQLRPVPPGECGEVLVGGPGVARGYLHRPELTAERFVEAAPAGRRFFRTGDFAREVAPGRLEFLGRRDDQVKVRGYRVELGEIEANLREHPAVKEAAVAFEARAGTSGRLLAAVVADGADEASVRSWLRARLPAHMLPAGIRFVDRLPLATSGKVDRAEIVELGAEEAPEPPSPAANGEPAGLIGSIWRELLGRGGFGVHDDFFACGGDSLLALRLRAEIGRRFGVSLPLGDLFASCTISQLASLVTTASPERDRVRPRGRGSDRLPLTAGQRGLWFISRVAPESSALNLGGTLRLRGPLDLRALEEALAGVVRRHEALRQEFHDEVGRPFATVTQEVAPLEIATLDGGAGLPRALSRHVNAAFDLTTGRPYRFALYRLGPKEHVLALVFHHIVFDGASWGIVLADLADGYRASVGAGPGPSDPPVQYPDFALWEEDHLSKRSVRDQLEFWRDALDGRPDARLFRPATGRTPWALGRVEARTVREIDRGALLQVCRETRATPFMALLAAYATFLHRATGRSDVVVGAPVTLRTDDRLRRTVGYLVNTLPLRIELDPRASFRDLLTDVRRIAARAYANREAPFEQIVAAAGDRATAATPLFQAMLAFDQGPDREPPLPGLEARFEFFPARDARIDLELALTDWRDEITGFLGFAEHVFSAAEADALAGTLRETIAACVREPAAAIGHLAEVPAG